MTNKVLVAMSGGVDSSVAAALLKEQGYFVVGGFMKNFSSESWSGVMETDCPWEQDFRDVQEVCKKLDIECRSFNFEKEYRDLVIEYFFSEYETGRTPNPDVMCNKEIKFGLFLNKALELGFDYVATGHYARIQSALSLRAKRSNPEIATASTPRDDRTYSLLKGVDPKKDQSYFLYTLSQEQLSRTLFPIGEYTKPRIRKLARKFGLPNAQKKDSQGICFVGQVNLKEFLKQRLPEKAGEIVDFSGQVLGSHTGAWYYTIGQRHGLGLGGGEPYYVAQKDVVRNRIMVAPQTLVSELLKGKHASVRDIHWINTKPDFPFHCYAKIRYGQRAQRCIVSRDKVEFARKQFAIAPGQSIVFYEGDTVLGGGIIT